MSWHVATSCRVFSALPRPITGHLRQFAPKLRVPRLVPADAGDGPESPEQPGATAVDGEFWAFGPLDLPVAARDHREAVGICAHAQAMRLGDGPKASKSVLLFYRSLGHGSQPPRLLNPPFIYGSRSTHEILRAHCHGGAAEWLQSPQFQGAWLLAWGR